MLGRPTLLRTSTAGLRMTLMCLSIDMRAYRNGARRYDREYCTAARTSTSKLSDERQHPLVPFSGDESVRMARFPPRPALG